MILLMKSFDGLVFDHKEEIMGRRIWVGSFVCAKFQLSKFATGLARVSKVDGLERVEKFALENQGTIR